MYRVSLINMPFAALQQPSLALTQLKAVLVGNFKNRVSVEILYLNHDFAHYLGVELAQLIAFSSESHNSGLGDWIFRQAAFPELPDNGESYFQRFFPIKNQQIEFLKQTLMKKLSSLDQFTDQLIDKYKLDQADLVGFTSMFSQNAACFALARRIKERNPKALCLMGGANCESPMGQEIAKNVAQIDFVFSGPGLKSFPQFIGHCLDQELEKCHRIPGVFSKANCSLNVLSGTATLCEELDIDTPIDLDYDEFLATYDKNLGGTKIKPILLFETSRGCWWGERAHCTFCGLNGASMGYRSMKPENALKQFDSLFRYESKAERLECVDNILPRNYAREVFLKMKTPPSMNIFYEVKADLTEEEMEILSNARVKSVQPGVEALATPTLKLMKKGTTSFQNLSLLKNCVLYDVFPVWNLLIGFPGEQEEVYRKYVEDMPLFAHLPPPNGVYPVRFDRYSPYFVKAKEYGLDLHPVDYYEFIYPFDTVSLSNLAYYFADHNFGAQYIRLVTKWIAELQAKVSQWKNRWHDEQPKLFFKGNGGSTVVYDSRSGKVVEHDITTPGRQILDHLNRPRRLTDLASELNSVVPGFDPAKELALLQDRGLVFQEGDRFFNLVLAKEPPKPTFTTWE